MHSSPIHLPLVRRFFDEIGRVSESSFLRREIAERMRDKLELVKIDASRVLDAGCGDGADLPALQERFPQAQVVGVDGAKNLLSGCLTAQRESHPAFSFSNLLQKFLPLRGGSKPAYDLLCGDFAQLALLANSVDVIWSNLALHWHSQPDKVFAEWHRVLRVKGLVMFSCFGPDTMIELREAFAEVDHYPHVLSFVDMHDFGDMLVKAGYATPVMDMEKITLSYQNVDRLLLDVKALGGNPLSTRRKGLLGRRAYQKLRAVLESRRDAHGAIPLTFEVVYGHAFKPQASKLASGESIIRFDHQKNHDWK